MTTVTNAFLELAYDAERDGFPQAAASFRKLAHGTTDIPGDGWSAADVIRALEIVRDLPKTAEPPIILAARAYDQAPSPEHYATLKQAWEAAGLPVKECDAAQYDDGSYRDPIETVIGTVGDITCTRVDSAPDRSWLDFTAGTRGDYDRVLVGVDIVGGRPGCELLIWGNQINQSNPYETMTLDQLRQIHAELGAMLADERLLAAFAAQPADAERRSFNAS